MSVFQLDFFFLGSLEIDQVVLEDQGSYRCNASSGNLYKLSNKAILTVNTDPGTL